MERRRWGECGIINLRIPVRWEGEGDCDRLHQRTRSLGISLGHSHHSICYCLLSCSIHTLLTLKAHNNQLHSTYGMLYSSTRHTVLKYTERIIINQIIFMFRLTADFIRWFRSIPLMILLPSASRNHKLIFFASVKLVFTTPKSK